MPKVHWVLLLKAVMVPVLEPQGWALSHSIGRYCKWPFLKGTRTSAGLISLAWSHPFSQHRALAAMAGCEPAVLHGHTVSLSVCVHQEVMDTSEIQSVRFLRASHHIKAKTARQYGVYAKARFHWFIVLPAYSVCPLALILFPHQELICAHHTHILLLLFPLLAHEGIAGSNGRDSSSSSQGDIFLLYCFMASKYVLKTPRCCCVH